MSKLDFSYASKSEHNIAQRMIIKTIEAITGKRKLENLYKKYSSKEKEPELFWSNILEIMGITINNKSRNKIFLPAKNPLIIIANHPFGIIDGLILCSIASRFRKDFKIMTHETLQFLPELRKFILPINFVETSKELVKKNIETTIKARKHLLNNGLLIIFPSGSVSVNKKNISLIKNDNWKLFTAKIIHQTKTDVLPIYFDGSNGFLFHLFAGKMKSQTLKYSSYIHETKKKIGQEIDIYFGKILKYEDLSNYNNRKELIEFLKYSTYNLKNEG